MVKAAFPVLVALSLIGVPGLAGPKGAKTYTNPVHPNVPDPGVMRHNGTYYVYGTNPGIGFKVFTSPDLVTWTDAGMALKPGAGMGKGDYWAPEVVMRGKQFYMFYTADQRLYVARSSSPRGPFTRHAGPMLNRWSIDSSYFKDKDGREYLYWNEGGGKGIFVAELENNVRFLGRITHCISDRTHPEPKWVTGIVNEAPYVLEHKKWYYLVYSANPTGPRYGVGYATASSPRGPWTKYSGNPIMHKNGAGHCSFVRTRSDQLMVIYHMHVGPPGRHLCVDRATFAPDPRSGGRPDLLKIHGPTVTPQAVPVRQPNTPARSEKEQT